MKRYCKTVYIEIDADDEEDAMEGLSDALLPLAGADNNITYVDLEGPIEEVEND